jgi:glycosyltransferase involved in cell wall biosynthesis
MRDDAKEAPPGIVSVITPVYNGEEHLRDCMLSVARSEFTDNLIVEHVLVNDGSTDKSAEVFERAKEELAKFPTYRPIFIEMEHVGRPSVMRNRGVKECSGDYLYFLDHDDVILKHTLQSFLNVLVERSQSFVYGNYISGDPHLRYRLGSDYSGRPFKDVVETLAFLFDERMFQHCFMLRRALFEQVGGYNEQITFGEDYDLSVRCVLKGNVPQFLPITAFMRRNRDGRITKHYRDTENPWKAEHRAHFLRFRSELQRVLPPEIFATIQEAAWLHDDSLPSHPLTMDQIIELAESERAQKSNAS